MFVFFKTQLVAKETRSRDGRVKIRRQLCNLLLYACMNIVYLLRAPHVFDAFRRHHRESSLRSDIIVCACINCNKHAYLVRI